MTELTITPKVSDKTARFKGTIAAGEHVAVTIKGGAEWIGEDEGANLTLRVIDLVTKRTLAVFPRPPEVMDEGAEPDAWGSSGDDLTCTLNLNSDRMVAAARHMLRVPVMFVLGDTDAPRTLYFCDRYEVEYWPERMGDDTPYDLDAWPKQIDEWMELVDEWTEQMATFGETLSGHVGNVGIHVTEEQKAVWTAKQNAIADLDAIRAGAARGATAIQSHQDISGKADLVGGKVPQSQLPSYVDDVLEYASLANFPSTGEEGKIYVAKDTNKTYRWSGTGYVQVGGSDIPVDSALSETSENPVQNRVVTEALNVRPTKEQIDAGWWSEWTILRDGVDVTAQVQQPEYVSDGGGASWIVDVVPTEERALSPSEDDADASELTWKGVDVFEVFHDYTATRHRVAAPVPTKTSDLTNDGPDGEHPFLTSHQTWNDVKPSGGIPKTDLASAVQTSLDKADTALQSHQSLAGLMPMYPFDANPTMEQRLSVLAACFPIVYTPQGGSAVTITSGNADDVTVEWSYEDGAFNVYYDGTEIFWAYDIHYYAGTDGQITFNGDTPLDGETLALGPVNTLTVSPYTSSTYTATSTAAAFEIAVGALPTGVTGKARDCILVIDCTATGAVAPTVTWPSNFHPRTDTATDMAIVEAGKVAVFYISEYAAGEFAVGGWVETAGGSGT